MAQRPRQPPLAGLRRLLLLLLLVGFAGLVWLLVAGQAGDERKVAEDVPRSEIPPGDITLLGEGFEFTQTEKNLKVFRIEGASVRIRQGNQVLLDQVRLTLYDDDQTAYHVVADEASFDHGTRDARLSGNVRLSGPQGMELTCRGLLLKNRGRLAESTSPVAFAYAGAYDGQGDRLRILFPEDLLTLAGNVRVTSTLPAAAMTLTADNVFMERPRKQIRATGNVELRQGGNVVRGRRLNMFLSDDERRVTFVRARWEVSGRYAAPQASPDQPSALRFTARSVSMLMKENGTEPRSVEFEGAPDQRTVVTTQSATGVLQTLDASYIVTRLEGVGGRYMEAFGRPTLVESRVDAPDAVLRRVIGDRLRAVFDGQGELSNLESGPDVELEDGTHHAIGDRLTFEGSGETGEAELFGTPVEVTSERGELTSPHVVLERKSGLLRADQGVSALLQDGDELGFDGTPLGEGEGPIRVEAETAFFRDQPRAALFRGGARAWRGSSLLVGDEIRADVTDEGDVLSARGNVKTLWIDPTQGRQPVEVIAQEMEYRQGQGVLLYRGGVHSQQGGRKLSGKRLEVELDDDGRARTMACYDTVRLTDPASGNRAEGDQALYDLAARTIDLRGAPAKMVKSDGAELQGRRVLYELDGGRGRVLGTGDEAADEEPEGEQGND
ncbi:MAG: LPS export ABC transporter periplasmic protein LptC [Acidobacteriota bacterium]